MTTNGEVAGRVRGIASARHITQTRLAHAMHMSRMSLSRRFSGAVPLEPEELSRLAELLGVHVGDFFEGAI